MCSENKNDFIKTRCKDMYTILYSKKSYALKEQLTILKLLNDDKIIKLICKKKRLDYIKPLIYDLLIYDVYKKYSKYFNFSNWLNIWFSFLKDIEEYSKNLNKEK